MADFDRNENSNGAIIRFLQDWAQLQIGDIKRSGLLTIEYDPDRLSHCHVNWRGADIWEISVYVRFNPGGQLYEDSVLQELRDAGGTVYAHIPKPVHVSVPGDANEVELWFRTRYQLSSYCEAWDSRFGQNYIFDVTS